MKIRHSALALAAVTAMSALCMTGCTNDEGAEKTPEHSNAVVVDEQAAALLPDAVAESGILQLGTDAEYPPNTYKDQNGNPVGWEVDVANAIAAKLGLEPNWEILGFDSILSRIEEGVVDMGAASFFSTLERRRSPGTESRRFEPVSGASQKRTSTRFSRQTSGWCADRVGRS